MFSIDLFRAQHNRRLPFWPAVVFLPARATSSGACCSRFYICSLISRRITLSLGFCGLVRLRRGCRIFLGAVGTRRWTFWLLKSCAWISCSLFLRNNRFCCPALPNAFSFSQVRPELVFLPGDSDTDFTFELRNQLVLADRVASINCFIIYSHYPATLWEFRSPSMCSS